jgi:hypothetical protein
MMKISIYEEFRMKMRIYDENHDLFIKFCIIIARMPHSWQLDRGDGPGHLLSWVQKILIFRPTQIQVTWWKSSWRGLRIYFFEAKSKNSTKSNTKGRIWGLS